MRAKLELGRMEHFPLIRMHRAVVLNIDCHADARKVPMPARNGASTAATRGLPNGVRMQRREFQLSLLLATATAFPGCGRKEAVPIVSIQKISPSGDVPLTAGSTVNFEVEVRVDALKAPATISLIAQAADGSVLGECSPVQAVGGSTNKLSLTVQVPETSSVRVFVPLYLQGRDQTDLMDMRDFKVVGRVS